MLCELAHSFPTRVAELLERDKGLRRNFREETVTDILMASLVGLEPFGIRVDFPDEPTTGGDMEWIFAAPLELKGGRYIRLILQAKRAQFAQLKSSGYWYYHHLDHGKPLGEQAQTLVAQSDTAVLPLYILYHPTSALTAATATLPAVEGINLVFARDIAGVVNGGCKKKEKKVDYWRSRFMPLSDLLCWPTEIVGVPGPDAANVTQLLLGTTGFGFPTLNGGFHPDLVAQRLNRRRHSLHAGSDIQSAQVEVTPINGIPQVIQRAIAGEVTREDRTDLKRPRVILSTRINRGDAVFAQTEELSRR